MKRILVTGAGSYIGMAFERYMEQFSDKYYVDTLDMLSTTWGDTDFSKFDAIYHVAGIAHQKETAQNAPLYYQVNCDLAVKTAQLAKRAGVRHFLYLSTMSIYGADTGIITPETPPNPHSHYGKSKWMAEKELCALQDENFAVSLIRPPMVYGKDCKGNFQTLLKLIKKLPMFPKIVNQRSMIYVDHLSEFVKQLIDQKQSGVFCPQNREYVNTQNLAKIVADNLPKRLRFSRLMGIAVWFCKPMIGKLKKAFGSLQYVDTEKFDFNYCIYDFEETVKRSISIGKE